MQKQKMLNKKAQVWVETVIYTLIALVLIGTVLAFATPVIMQQKDKATIEKTAAALQELDNAIITVKNFGTGNARKITFFIGKGNLIIDSLNENIIFIIDESRYAYSEPGYEIEVSGTNIKAKTEKAGKKYKVTLKLEYENEIDLTYNNNEVEKQLSAGPNPYIFLVKNKGEIIDPLTQESLVNIDITEISTA